MNKLLFLATAVVGFNALAVADNHADPLLGNDLLLDDIGITLDSSDLGTDLLIIDPLPDESLLIEPANDTDPLLDPLLDLDPLVPQPVTPVAPIVEPEPTPAAPQPVEQKQITQINVDETFYKLVLNSSTNSYQRTPVTQARPGDLIELVITASNESNNVASNLELTNTVPTGNIDLLTNSFKTNLSRSLYRYSTNGQSFFPADATIDPQAIRYIQWVIFELPPQDSMQFSYRIRIRE